MWGVCCSEGFTSKALQCDINASAYQRLAAPLASSLSQHRFKEFGAAFKECRDHFDVIVNCVSAKVDFSGMMGMLAHDGVAVQVGV